MASVDDRIVAMKFDNSSFNQRVADTIKTLDDLKTAMDFSKTKDSIADLERLKTHMDFSKTGDMSKIKQNLADVQTMGKKFNLNTIAEALAGISGKFSAFGVVAFSVLDSITRKALEAGTQLAKSLSLDQVLSGYSEYELTLNSIQTILANTKSKGTTLEDVNGALDELNTYSDKTIYNFAQMAKNIGTFTAAGVDLDTSVGAIKGIANLAAVSGSSSEQASMAMYQLSQAISTGTLRLIDWNSVTNAGLGGEVFQKSLFETGKALKTLTDVPVGQTFEEWLADGNTFRGSLEDNWLTADVLTQTLSGFTGDLSEAQLLSMGYTKEQSAGILEMGVVAQEAATKVKTMTQLIGTVKESIGSGWSQTFRTIFGDFEQARNTFTVFNDAIGAVVTRNADARNELFTAWAQMGGRRNLIAGITNAFEALGGILAPIKAAFHDIFPPVTAMRLAELTRGFRNLMERLKPTPAVAVLITRTFRGIFSLFSIGIHIVKEIVKTFLSLFDGFNKSNDPNKGILGFTAKWGDAIYELKKVLVDGEGIAKFFDKIKDAVTNFIKDLSFENALDKVKELGQLLKDALFNIFDDGDATTENPLQKYIDRIVDVGGVVGTIVEKIVGVWEWFKDKFGPIKDFIVGAAGAVKDAFSGFGEALSTAFDNVNYDGVLDTVNTGLFAALVLMFQRFLSGNFFGGGLWTSVTQSFGALTTTLTTMQQNIKADTLMKIAIAVGVLTASVFVLSLIDSAALTRSMAAIAVGFGQLVGAMALLTKVVTGPQAALTMVLVSGAILLIAGAMVVLAVAARIMATMDMAELAKGLGGVLTLIGVVVAASGPLSENSGGMIKAGVGIIALSFALIVLGGAMKIFATMSWEDMSKGMIGVAGGLSAITVATNNMPDTLALKGLGVLLIAGALLVLSAAMKIFATMEWEDIVKGFVGVAGGLGIMALALDFMPNPVTMVLQGAALLMISTALIAIAKAMLLFSEMSWSEMAHGIVALAGTLLALALGLDAMQTSLPGALAVVIAATGLRTLAGAIKLFAKIGWAALFKGLAGMVLAMVALGVGALLIEPALGPLLAFSAVLIVLSAAIALFGIGANLLAGAFATIAGAGMAGVDVLAGTLKVITTALPGLIVAIADGFLSLIKIIIKALPDIIKGLGKALAEFVKLIIENIPLFAEALTEFIKAGLKVIRDTFPEFVATGFAMLIAMLTGIRDNIGEIVTLVGEIITNFLDAFAAQVDPIIDSVFNLIMKIIEGVIAKLVDIGKVLLPKGLELLQGLWDGVQNKALELYIWFTGLPDKIKGWIGNVIETLLEKGKNLITGLKSGIEDAIVKVITWFTELPGKIVGWIGSLFTTLNNAGKDLISGLWNGMLSMKDWIIEKVKKAAIDWVVSPFKAAWNMFSPSKVMAELGVFLGEGLVNGMDSMEKPVMAASQGISTAVADGFDVDHIATSFAAIVAALTGELDTMEEFNPVITPVLDLTNVKATAGQINGLLGSYGQAQAISLATSSSGSEVDVVPVPSGTTELKYIQNNYSPKALSVADLYRQTRNQLVMAKEDLGAP